MSLLAAFNDYWTTVNLLREQAQGIELSGQDLTLAHVVAASRYDVVPEFSKDERVKAAVDRAKDWLGDRLAKAGTTAVYAVNTGVGDRGVNTRTTAIYDLQRSLLEAAFCGIIPSPSYSASTSSPAPNYNPTFHPSTLLLPEPWVKGTIVVRLNTLIRGMSGVSWEVVERFRQLLVHDIVPCVPLRQSISASGDLATLGYIAGSIQYRIPTRVWTGPKGNRTITTSQQALGSHFPNPVSFGPKEVIATINGTAPSCAVASLALHDSILLAHLSQILTAMAVEALTGTLESFDPFLHEICRPHPGQVEVASNITRMLAKSHLACNFEEDEQLAKLRQDRYSTRTSPQWLGPHIEELHASLKTLEIEMNSTSDNPIIDTSTSRDLHGGNFQGTSIALTMEKTKIGLQHMGKIAYAQMSELVNTKMSRGLPPDLAAGEPSVDFGFKGIDIGTAAYQAELSFMSNTVTNHVQSAELHNQSINSLALVAARTTYTSIQLLQMIFTNHLFGLCQALDLRAMSIGFFSKMKESIKLFLAKSGLPEGNEENQKLGEKLFRLAKAQYALTGDQDSETRFDEVVKAIEAEWIYALSSAQLSNTETDQMKGETSRHPSNPVTTVRTLSAELSSTLRQQFRANRSWYFREGSAEPLLGETKHLYNFIRKTLKVKMLRSISTGADIGSEEELETTDVQFARIYESFDSGEIIGPVLRCLSAANREGNDA